MNIKSIKNVLIALTLSATFTATLAFQGDSSLPARITSESMEIDFKTGARTLIGNVSIFQGSFELYADKVIAEYNGDTLIRATAFGNPAIVKDQPDADTKVDGKAQRIELDRTTNDIILIDNANLKQDTTDKNGNPMKLDTNGQRISYNLNRETLKVTGGNTSTKSVGNQTPPAAKPKPQTTAPAAPVATSTAQPIENSSIKENSNKQSAPVAIVGEEQSTSAAQQNTAPVVEAPVEVPRSSGRTRLVILPKGGTNKKMQNCGKGDEDDPDYVECGDDK